MGVVISGRDKKITNLKTTISEHETSIEYLEAELREEQDAHITDIRNGRIAPRNIDVHRVQEEPPIKEIAVILNIEDSTEVIPVYNGDWRKGETREVRYVPTSFTGETISLGAINVLEGITDSKHTFKGIVVYHIPSNRWIRVSTNFVWDIRL